MLNSKLQLFFNLTKSGVNSDSGDELARRILFSNIVFISLPIVYTIFISIDYKTYLKPAHLRFDQFVVPIIIAICAFCIWLNKRHRTSISRNIFLAAWPLLLHIIPIYLLDTPTDYVLAFPIGLIFHSVLIQLMFSHKHEAKQFWFWLSINVVTTCSSAFILSYYDTDRSLSTDVISNKYYTLDCISYWLLFNLVTFYTILELEKNIQQIRDSTTLVENQRDQLNKLNANLEKIVLQRTLALEEQNSKLRNYAFYNAHLLRGPFCRIQGLIHLQDLASSNPDDQQLIRSKLNQCIEELDQRIHEIQHIVQEENFEKVMADKASYNDGRLLAK